VLGFGQGGQRYRLYTTPARREVLHAHGGGNGYSG